MTTLRHYTGMENIDGSVDRYPSRNMPATARTLKLDTLDLEINPFTGNALSSEDARVILAFTKSKSTLVIELTDCLVLGRGDSLSYPGMYADLSAYNAISSGVSRNHAVLHRINHTIAINDLGSANGTYLNGDRLVPQQVRFLRHGDEILLGKLAFRINFE
jgi:pSer/pThr/pTyr-binding forkhead associated (FHA) protein